MPSAHQLLEPQQLQRDLDHQPLALAHVEAGDLLDAAQALYVHPNTLRQRLRRIEEITGLDVREGDWLMIEIALKLLRLEALET